MNKAAGIIHKTLEQTCKTIRPGQTTESLAQTAYLTAIKGGADPGIIIHISPEEVVWHGPPGSRILIEGEIVTIDIACSVSGWWADAARTFAVGNIDDKHRELMKAALSGMKETVAAMKVGTSGPDISGKLKEICRNFNVKLISEGAGHGIGKGVHEPPSITYDGRNHAPLKSGYVYSAEPIFTSGGGKIAISSDGSATTIDCEPSAHYEVTAVIREHGAQVLGAPDWLDDEPG